ncbi:molybdate ABC transporter substrate-binding protein [uncultured Jatrophihabitans sp.]|uniref:molybdate ABC transporter substrate-binding protein n=1 Tax=uncultured Jatrophihabitans sp. TaxID=1610747 RepID=UPI0035CA7B02
MKRVVLGLSAVLLLVAGCSSSGSGGKSSAPASAAASGSGSSSTALSGSITVYAAASLTEAFGTLSKQFQAAHPGTTVKTTYGASSDLSTQISQGAPVDVFASASTKNMTSLGSAAQNPTNFVSNTLEIAVPPSNPGKVSSVNDLAKSGVKVAVCDPAVPCGVVAAKVFTNAKIKVNPVAREKDVKSTLAIVQSGEVDAGLVYVTDVRAAGAKVKGVTIPSSVNASTEYPIATLKSAKNAALASAFVAYVLSATGKKVLTADGFSNP